MNPGLRIEIVIKHRNLVHYLVLEPLRLNQRYNFINMS